MTDKEAAEILSKDLGKYILTEHDVAILTAINALEEKPKGEWKIKEHIDSDGSIDGYDVYCSECGKLLLRLISRRLSEEEVKAQTKEDFTNFCCDCGADMRRDNNG